MKKTLAAFALAMLSTQAMAFDYYRSMDQESARKRQLADYQRLEYDTTYQRTQQNNRLMQLEQQQRKHQQDSEWRIRQLEAEQYRPAR
jgi:hypothetical protein